MNNNNELLEEYAEVSRELDNIKNQIIEFKNKTQEKLKSVQSEDEEMSVFLEYKNQVDKFTQDKETKRKYKSLQKRKQELEQSICSIERLEKSKNNDNVFKCNNSNSSDDKSTNTCDNSLDDLPNNVMNDINTLIKKYKKFVKIPIENKNMECAVKKKINNKNQQISVKKSDNEHMEGLANLINSLKGIEL